MFSVLVIIVMTKATVIIIIMMMIMIAIRICKLCGRTKSACVCAYNMALWDQSDV